MTKFNTDIEILAKDCYYNNYKLSKDNYTYLTDNNIKVAIGYCKYKQNDNYMLRHCYLANADGTMFYDLASHYLKSRAIEYYNSVMIEPKIYISIIEEAVNSTLYDNYVDFEPILKRLSRAGDNILFDRFGDYTPSIRKYVIGSDLLIIKDGDM